MKLIETSVFVQQIQRLLSNEEYTALRKYLKDHPDIAPIMQGTGGARKMRWAKKGKEIFFSCWLLLNQTKRI